MSKYRVTVVQESTAQAIKTSGDPHFYRFGYCKAIVDIEANTLAEAAHNAYIMANQHHPSIVFGPEYAHQFSPNGWKPTPEIKWGPKYAFRNEVVEVVRLSRIRHSRVKR